MVGVEIGEIIEPGKRLVDGRVVFHRARAQRIETLVQVEVEPAEAAEMPGHLGLAERGDRQRRLPAQGGRHQLVKRSCLDPGGGEPRARPVRASQLEEQGLAHASASRKRSIAFGWLSSVTEISRASDSSGKNRPNGKPGRTPRSRRKAWVCSAGGARIPSEMGSTQAISSAPERWARSLMIFGSSSTP